MWNSQNVITFLGHIFTQVGFKLNFDEVQAIFDYSLPTTVK